jgi:hypothetical protein
VMAMKALRSSSSPAHIFAYIHGSLCWCTVLLFSRSQADDSGSTFWLDEFSAVTKKGTEYEIQGQRTISLVSDLGTVAMN